MVDIHKVIERMPFKPKKGFVLPKHRFTGPFNPLHLQLISQDNPLPGNEPYNAVDAIYMRHDFCCRDNDTPAGKRECDRKMLAELNALIPKGRCEKVDRHLVRSIIGLKHRIGLDVHWINQLANELHKPVRRRFEKPTVFAKQVYDIWTADLVDMSPFSRSNKGYKYLLTVIDVFSKLTPSDVRNPAKYQHVHDALYAKVNARKAVSPKFHVGGKVRITRKKGTFEKGFTPNWKEEVFTISSVKATKPPMYTIVDTLGEPVQGTFYKQELQSSVQEIIRIERVLKMKKNQVFVKCKSYNNAYR